MRRTEEEAEATRQELLMAALRLFSERGYAATRLSDVAQAAGATRGAIYHHFENKAHLYRSLLDKFAGQFSSEIGAAIQEGGSFLEICRRVMVRPLDALEKDVQFAAFYELVQFHTVDIPELRGAHAQQLAEAGAVLEQVSGYFRAGIKQGSVRSSLDPEALARAFIALQNGLIHLWLVRQRAFSLSKTARAAADVFVAGIAAPGSS